MSFFKLIFFLVLKMKIFAKKNETFFFYKKRREKNLIIIVFFKYKYKSIKNNSKTFFLISFFYFFRCFFLIVCLTGCSRTWRDFFVVSLVPLFLFFVFVFFRLWRNFSTENYLRSFFCAFIFYFFLLKNYFICKHSFVRERLFFIFWIK